MNSNRQAVLDAEFDKISAIANQAINADKKIDTIFEKTGKTFDELVKSIEPVIRANCEAMCVRNPSFKVWVSKVAAVQGDMKSLATSQKEVDQSLAELKKLEAEFKSLSDQLKAIKPVVEAVEPLREIKINAQDLDCKKALETIGKKIGENILSKNHEKIIREHYDLTVSVVDVCVKHLNSANELATTLSSRRNNLITSLDKKVKEVKSKMKELLDEAHAKEDAKAKATAEEDAKAKAKAAAEEDAKAKKQAELERAKKQAEEEMAKQQASSLMFQKAAETKKAAPSSPPIKAQTITRSGA